MAEQKEVSLKSNNISTYSWR